MTLEQAIESMLPHSKITSLTVMLKMLGGRAVVAKCLDISTNSIKHWVIRDAVPLQRRAAIRRLALRQGVTLTPKMKQLLRGE